MLEIFQNVFRLFKQSLDFSFIYLE